MNNIIELLNKSQPTESQIMTVASIGITPILSQEVVELARVNTEHSVELAFRLQFAGKLKYSHTSSAWYIWDGKCWARDFTQTVTDLCRAVSTSVIDSKNAHRFNFFKSVEKIAQSDRVFAITADKFDADNYLLNTPEGTIDLKTGICRKHDQADLITNITTVSMGHDYGVRFAQFLDEITCSDKELAYFLQVALGACLSGAIENHWMMFWIGSGRNGKNTLGEAVMDVMGTYARKIPSSVLMKHKNEGHPTEIANLMGCRLAVGSEVDQTAYWSESKLNELTGDARISARFMRGDLFEFFKTFKFLIYGNHRPRLNSITPAIRSRIKMIPFKGDFTKNGDPELKAKLAKEYPSILKWLVDGHLAWMFLGKKLPPCKAIDDEMNDYIEAQATIENWMDECLTPDEKEKNSASELFSHYKGWKESRGELASSQTVWGEAMSSRFTKRKTNRGFVYSAKLNSEAVLSGYSYKPHGFGGGNGN
jgi:putative DNA primase/helicase